MELLRRLILVGSLFTAGALAYTPSLSPLISIRFIDFAEKFETEIRAARALLDMSKGDKERRSRLSEKYERLSKMTLKEYVEEYFHDQTIGIDKRVKGLLSKEELEDAARTRRRTVGIVKIESREWEDFLQKVIAVSRGKISDRQWIARFPSEQYHLKNLFFKINEPPISRIAGNVRGQEGSLYISSVIDGEPQYFEIKYHEYSDQDFTIFGFLRSPRPPTDLFYPYRNEALLLVAAGLASYTFLPRLRRGKEGVRYPLWMILLGDAAALIFTVPFFILPAVIVGGFRQAFFEAWPLILVFWMLSLIGLYLFKIAAWYAAYEIVVLNDRIRLSTYRGTKEYLYRDMNFFQPVIFKPPRWLIMMIGIAALANRGAARLGGIGRALMLAGSEYGSIAIGLRNGAMLYINLTNAMGRLVLKEARRIIESLRSAGVKEKKEVQIIRSMGLETLRFPKK